jgi:hypothetical protein
MARDDADKVTIGPATPSSAERFSGPMGGIRLEPAEVEAVLRGDPGVAEGSGSGTARRRAAGRPARSPQDLHDDQAGVLNAPPPDQPVAGRSVPILYEWCLHLSADVRISPPITGRTGTSSVSEMPII